MTNEEAHQLFSTFKNLADEYNQTGFEDLSPGLLAAYNSMIDSILNLFRFLYKRSNGAEASRLALADAAKLKARIYHLKNNQRKETDLERLAFIRGETELLTKETDHETD